MDTRMLEEIYDQPSVLMGIFDRYGSEFKPLGERLARADRVFLVGTGASLCACEAARWAFMFGGIVPHILPAAFIREYSSCFRRNDIVILVSQSGQSLETKEAVEILGNTKTPLWGLTNNPDSVLAEASHEALLLGAGNEVSSATKTHTGSLAVFYSLACGAAEAGSVSSGVGMLRTLHGIPESVERTLGLCRAHIDGLADEWASAIAGFKCGYSLGSGLQGHTAEQGALMLKEKAFMDVEGMSLSEFRHGPVEVVHRGLPILVTATGEHLTEAVGHSGFLTDLGADVTLISDGGASGWNGRSIPISTLGSEEFHHISATIPHQLLAEGLARRLGYEVDAFRHISKVVDRY